jgi:hypothetical protein
MTPGKRFKSSSSRHQSTEGTQRFRMTRYQVRSSARFRAKGAIVIVRRLSRVGRPPNVIPIKIRVRRLPRIPQNEELSPLVTPKIVIKLRLHALALIAFAFNSILCRGTREATRLTRHGVSTAVRTSVWGCGPDHYQHTFARKAGVNQRGNAVAVAFCVFSISALLRSVFLSPCISD